MMPYNLTITYFRAVLVKKSQILAETETATALKYRIIIACLDCSSLVGTYISQKWRVKNIQNDNKSANTLNYDNKSANTLNYDNKSANTLNYDNKSANTLNYDNKLW